VGTEAVWVGVVGGAIVLACGVTRDIGPTGGTDAMGPADAGSHAPRAGGSYDGGPQVAGTVGPTGGSVSRLLFAIVGDTRPPSEDDTAAYPTAIITRIYARMNALSPRPSFAVSTGDYQFASPRGDQGAAQLDVYLGARARFAGVLFPSMGNHECTGATASNCGAGNPDGLTNNFKSYVSKLLSPIGRTDPYYEVDIDAVDRSWTAKFLFVAANAWTSAQESWLVSAMQRSTTYTFLVRHEPADATSAPGVLPAERVMLGRPYTLSIVGHSHTYARSGAREVIVGNGGAPATGGKDYGFGIVSQQADGSLSVDMLDQLSGLADPDFHFAVKADGSPAR